MHRMPAQEVEGERNSHQSDRADTLGTSVIGSFRSAASATGLAGGASMRNKTRHLLPDAI